MAKIPSIEADIKMKAAADGGPDTTFAAGSSLMIAVASTTMLLEVRVLDALSGRKSHNVGAGDSAFVVFLLINHPTVSYDGLRAGARFEIVSGGQTVGAGVVQARVD